MFVSAREFVYCPFTFVVLEVVLGCLAAGSFWKLKGAGGRVFWQIEFGSENGSGLVRGASGLYSQIELKFIWRKLVYEWIQSERCLVISINSVVHNQKFTVRRVDLQRLQTFKIC